MRAMMEVKGGGKHSWERVSRRIRKVEAGNEKKAVCHNCKLLRYYRDSG